MLRLIQIQLSQLERLLEMVKIAFVGAGRIIKEHIKAFKAIEGCELTAIYNRTKKKAIKIAKEHKGLTVLDDICQLSHLNIDLCVIGVSIENTYTTCLKVAEYCKSILIEKPAGINLLEAKKLKIELEQIGCSAFVGLNRRYYSNTKALQKSLLKDPSRRFINIYDQEPVKDIKKSGNFSNEVIENWMYANSIHLIDYFSVLARGEITNITYFKKWEGLNSEFMSCSLDFSSGDKGYYECHFINPAPWRVVLTTQKQRWDLSPLESGNYIIDGKVKKIEQSIIDNAFKAGFHAQANQIVKFLNGRKANVVTINESLKSMENVSKIYSLQ